MYKKCLITIFSYTEKTEIKFRVYAKNLETNEIINPIVDKKFLVGDSYEEALKLIKKEINKTFKRNK